MSKHTTLDLEQDLTSDFNDAAITRRIGGLEARLKKTEDKLEAVYEELGDTTVKLMEHREAYARNAMADEQRGLQTLAKARSAVARLNTPDGLLERAEKVLDDPTAVGVLQSYVNSGQLKKAADMLAAAEARGDKQDEDGALQRVENQLEGHKQVALISELGEKVVSFERTLNSLLSRLSKLETRSAAPAAPAQTVAKGLQFGRRQKRRRPTPRTRYRGSRRASRPCSTRLGKSACSAQHSRPGGLTKCAARSNRPR